MPSPTYLSRRQLLVRGAVAASAAGLVVPRLLAPSAAAARTDTVGKLRALERRHGARLGVHARNHRTGATIDYRADERFAMCSVFKGLLAAHVLRDFDHRGEFLNRLIHYTKADLIEGAPVTEQYLDTGLTVRALCAAALAYSDNVAANLLLDLTGGPAGVTRFCRSIGDADTRLDRTEPTLNTSIPGDLRDTTTPRAIGDTYARVVLGRTLSPADRAQLTDWLQGDAVNTQRFRAGLPEDWLIADKTGTGDYGSANSANDVGVVWTSRRTPLSIAVLTVKHTADATADEQLIEGAARLVARTLAPGE
jgi:beta-lactamase class A